MTNLQAVYGQFLCYYTSSYFLGILMSHLILLIFKHVFKLFHVHDIHNF